MIENFPPFPFRKRKEERVEKISVDDDSTGEQSGLELSRIWWNSAKRLVRGAFRFIGYVYAMSVTIIFSASLFFPSFLEYFQLLEYYKAEGIGSVLLAMVGLCGVWMVYLKE